MRNENIILIVRVTLIAMMKKKHARARMDMRKILSTILISALVISVMTSIYMVEAEETSQSESPSPTLVGSTPPTDVSPEPSPPETAPPVAGLKYYTDRAAFYADNPGLLCEDFEEATILDGTIAGFDGPLDETTDNTYFNPGDILPGIRFQDNPGPDPNGLFLLGAGYMGNPSKNVGANTFLDSFDIIFPNDDVFAVGMDLVSYFDADVLTITIYGAGGALLDTTTALATNDGTFWGVSSDQVITRINLYSPTDQAEGVDNICFGALPPPVGGEYVSVNPLTLLAPYLVIVAVAAAGTAGILRRKRIL